ncbi:hypothetical protein F4778DRAFT_718320 [Xylariomycetidae sp. FL2044]|nr:hypothetical protein F4778DRAFT_718320 [Xylariomycetidae sp. FL2044]
MFVFMCMLVVCLNAETHDKLPKYLLLKGERKKNPIFSAFRLGPKLFSGSCPFFFLSFWAFPPFFLFPALNGMSVDSAVPQDRNPPPPPFFCSTKVEMKMKKKKKNEDTVQEAKREERNSWVTNHAYDF